MDRDNSGHKPPTGDPNQRILHPGTLNGGVICDARLLNAWVVPEAAEDLIERFLS